MCVNVFMRQKNSLKKWVPCIRLLCLSLALQIASLYVLNALFLFSVYKFRLPFQLIQYAPHAIQKHMRRNSGLVFNYCKYLATKFSIVSVT